MNGIPIEGRSHWCEGITADEKPCGQVVNNDSDHCEAGHLNMVYSKTDTQRSTVRFADAVNAGAPLKSSRERRISDGQPRH